MHFTSHRLRMKGGQWEDAPPTVQEMGELFDTDEGVNTLKKVIDDHKNEHIYMEQFKANVLQSRGITNMFMEQTHSKFLANKSMNIVIIERYLK